MNFVIERWEIQQHWKFKNCGKSLSFYRFTSKQNPANGLYARAQIVDQVHWTILVNIRINNVKTSDKTILKNSDQDRVFVYIICVFGLRGAMLGSI